MEGSPTLSSEQNAALVVLSFLHADCGNDEFGQAVVSLGKELTNTWATCRDDDGALEIDGHLPSNSIAAFIDDIEPLVELNWPGGHDEVAALQEVAARLRQISDQFQQHVVDQAARNLHRSIMSTPSDQWLDLLTVEVQRVMRQGVGLEQLPQEKVIMALSLTLVKQVCKHAPRLLGSLFRVALRCVSPPTSL
ncbi:BH3 interacting domain death agonist [Nerophis lumbriciformis]|uniref:BH3 interacting domain death agonist n=1 Tax=Nerophis lumbriciformis TaxID=546530 RepID=UPI003BAB5CE1